MVYHSPAIILISFCFNDFYDSTRFVKILVLVDHMSLLSRRLWSAESYLDQFSFCTQWLHNVHMLLIKPCAYLGKIRQI